MGEKGKGEVALRASCSPRSPRGGGKEIKWIKLRPVPSPKEKGRETPKRGGKKEKGRGEEGKGNCLYCFLQLNPLARRRKKKVFGKEEKKQHVGVTNI